MQANHCFRKRTFFLLPFIAISFILFPISSCHSDDKVKAFTQPEDCITMTWAQVNSWKQTGWGDPSNDRFIPCLYFNPIPAAPGQQIQVWSYPTNNDTVFQASRALPMSIATLKPPCGFPDGLTVLPNYYNFFENGFVNTNGDLIRFTYLRLIPLACASTTYPLCDGTQLCFRVELVTDSGGGPPDVAQKGFTKPCPPYCPIQ